MQASHEYSTNQLGSAMGSHTKILKDGRSQVDLLNKGSSSNLLLNAAQESLKRLRQLVYRNRFGQPTKYE